MKPSKNRVYCPDCRRAKMLFETEEKALHFLEYNKEDILQESEKAPVRAYFCSICNGWHLTSAEHARLDYLSHGEMAVLSSKIICKMENRIKQLEQTEKLQESISCIIEFSMMAQQVKSIKEIRIERYEKMIPDAKLRIKELVKKHQQQIRKHLKNQEYGEAIKLIDTLCQLSKAPNIETILEDEKIALDGYIKNRIKEIEEKITPRENLYSLKKKFTEKADIASKLVEFNYTSDAIKTIEELNDTIEEMKSEGLEKESIDFYKKQINQIIKTLEEKIRSNH